MHSSQEEDEGDDPFTTPAHGLGSVTPASVRRKAMAVADEFLKASASAARRNLAQTFQDASAHGDAAAIEEAVDEIINDPVIPDEVSQMEVVALEAVRNDAHQLRKQERDKRAQQKAKLARHTQNTRKHERSNTSPPISPASKRTVPTAVAGERDMVREWERDLADIVRRAMAPMLRFVGAVAVKVRQDDVRRLLVWNRDQDASMEDRVRRLVSKGARTVAEFMALNRDLGPPLLYRYLKAAEANIMNKEEEEEDDDEDDPPEDGINAHIGLAFDLNELDLPAATLQARYQKSSLTTLRNTLAQLRAVAHPSPQDQAQMDEIRRNIRLIKVITKASTGLAASDVEGSFAPAWCFEVMGDAVFRKLINDVTLAAFEMAHAKVRRIEGCESFTLKELICSEQVHDQFAFIVAAEWLNNGDETAAMSKQRGPRSRYMNMMIFRKHLGLQLDTCAIWFESVRARDNPLRAKFEAKKRQIVAALPIGTDATREHTETLDMYGAMLPARELVYYG
jgi:hypothetical protein